MHVVHRSRYPAQRSLQTEQATGSDPTRRSRGPSLDAVRKRVDAPGTGCRKRVDGIPDDPGGGVGFGHGANTTDSDRQRRLPGRLSTTKPSSSSGLLRTVCGRRRPDAFRSPGARYLTTTSSSGSTRRTAALKHTRPYAVGRKRRTAAAGTRVARRECSVPFGPVSAIGRGRPVVSVVGCARGFGFQTARSDRQTRDPGAANAFSRLPHTTSDRTGTIETKRTGTETSPHTLSDRIGMILVYRFTVISVPEISCLVVS